MSGERFRLNSAAPVFGLDRRLHRIDRWAVPVPGGVPYRAIGAAALAAVVIVVLTHLPIIGLLFAPIPGPLLYVVLPIAAGMLASQTTPDGRNAVRWAATWISYPLRAHRHVTIPSTVPVGADLSLRGRQAIRVSGPARLRFDRPAQIGTREPGAWWAQTTPGAKPRRGAHSGQEIELLEGEHLELVP